jgi:hypothetical protein
MHTFKIIKYLAINYFISICHYDLQVNGTILNRTHICYLIVNIRDDVLIQRRRRKNRD